MPVLYAEKKNGLVKNSRHDCCHAVFASALFVLGLSRLPLYENHYKAGLYLLMRIFSNAREEKYV